MERTLNLGEVHREVSHIPSSWSLLTLPGPGAKLSIFVGIQSCRQVFAMIHWLYIPLYIPLSHHSCSKRNRTLLFRARVTVVQSGAVNQCQLTCSYSSRICSREAVCGIERALPSGQNGKPHPSAPVPSGQPDQCTALAACQRN